jgi:hypothetical protein
LIENVVQSIKDKPLKRCPECRKHQLERVIFGGLLTSVKKVETVGQLEEQNNRKYKSQINEAQAKRSEETSQAPREWFDNPKYGNATTRELNKMSPAQKQRYIMEGKK